MHFYKNLYMRGIFWTLAIYNWKIDHCIACFGQGDCFRQLYLHESQANSWKIVTRMKNLGTWLRKQTKIMLKLLRKTDQNKAMDLTYRQRHNVWQRAISQDTAGWGWKCCCMPFFLCESTNTEQNRQRTCESWNLGPAEKNTVAQ